MNRIAIVRERAGITQVELYKKLNWRQSRLSNYEGGKRPLKLSDARQIVAALNELGANECFDDVFPTECTASISPAPQSLEED